MEEELFIPKTKHKALKIILAIILICGLITGGYFLYQYKFNNPKTIISSTLTKMRSEFNNTMSETKISDKLKVDGHLKINSNIDDETFKILNDLELIFNSELDYNNKIANFDLNTKYQNDKLIDFKGYYDNETIYLLLDEVYDKYIKFNINEADENINYNSFPKMELTKEDIQVIFDSFLKAYEKAISESEIKKNNETITIDGKKTEVINNFVELKDQEVNTFVKIIVNDLKENKSFVTLLTKLVGQDSTPIFDSLLQGIDEENYNGIYKICFYTNKGLLKKDLVSFRQIIIENNISTSINIDIINSDEILFSIENTNINYSVRIKKNNSAINLLCNINIDGQYINMELTMNYDEIKEINKTDVSNNIDYNLLTEEDMGKIEAKIKDNKNLLKLIDNINKLAQNEV